MKWKIGKTEDTDAITTQKFLDDGWEPFAVTVERKSLSTHTTIWFRKKIVK